MATCDQLDDYLWGWLDPDAAAEFADHLANCESCRSALELQQRIDRNLEAYRRSIAIPDSLVVLPVDVQRNPIFSGSRISGAALIAVPAAAVVLLGIGVGLYLGGRTTDKAVRPVPVVHDTADTEPLVSVEPEHLPDEEDASVVIQPGRGTILLQVPSSSSRVSVFRVYHVIGDPVDQSTQN